MYYLYMFLFHTSDVFGMDFLFHCIITAFLATQHVHILTIRVTS